MSPNHIRLVCSLSVFIAALFGSAVSYSRPPPRQNVYGRFLNEDDDSSPQQVHISLVGTNQMRITWITKDPAPSIVQYGTQSGSYPDSATGSVNTYSYLIYTSGQIHEVVIGPLKSNTVYYYRCGSDSTRELTFKTQPDRFPVKFSVVGDLGQTGWTESTLQHISESNYDVLLLPGDLSYADYYQPHWDTFGKLVEPLASQRPWMVTQGNHEVEKIPLLHGRSFTAYNARWRMPYEPANSNSNLYYSFNVAGVHIIMLGSYTDFEPGSDQYLWLENDMGSVERAKTPWVVVLVHAPWYNSNSAHQDEDESVKMKYFMESLLYKARVDIVFAGHVHAYERFTRVNEGKADECGAVHITIGDGGNREGLAGKWIDPKPDISVYREASFGHGQFLVENATHAQWLWFRNEDDVAKSSDSIWLTSLAFNANC